MYRLRTLIFLITTAATISAQDYKTVYEAEGLQAGVSAPMFKAIDADNQDYSLENALKEGPVVLIFYRGHWCPHCNRHLIRIQDSLDLIYELGASVIAISPEKPEYLEKAREETGSEFALLYDEGYRISDAYDVTFLPKKKQTMKYNTFTEAELKKAHSDDSQRLPIPATYIIDQDGIITWRHFDPNYKARSSVADILKVLSNK